jgi:hypothetical protein
VQETKIAPNEVPKTFTMLIEDYEYLQTYSRHMAFHCNSKYPLKRSLSDAIKLLRVVAPGSNDRLKEAPENHFQGLLYFLKV